MTPTPCMQKIMPPPEALEEIKVEYERAKMEFTGMTLK